MIGQGTGFVSDCCAPRATGDDQDPSWNNCPSCGTEGQRVKDITVRSLVHDRLVERVGDQDYLFCRTPDCPVVYFDNTGDRFFEKGDVRVRVWLKETEHPIPICYCRGVTERQILDAILDDGCPPTLQEVQRRTGAGQGGKCLTLNPSGRCCHPAIKDVIEKAEKMLHG